MSPQPAEADRFAALLRRLTARDRWLLAMLGEHTVLTTGQLHRLGWGQSLRAVQTRARILHRLGVLDRFQPSRDLGQGTTPLHLILGPLGAQVLAAETGHRLAQIGYRGRVAALETAHRMTLAHDVGASDLVCDLAHDPALTLRQWWSAARCRRCFGHHARPDAYLTLTTEAPQLGRVGGWWEMFLEYDTGTENLRRLTDKLHGFYALAAATGIVTPVGFWFTRTGREPHARRALAEVLRAQPRPDVVPVLTAAPHTTVSRTCDVHPGAPHARAGAPADNRAFAGPAGRAWLPLFAAHTSERVSLAALAAAQARPASRSDRPEVTRDTSAVPAPTPLPPPLPRTPRPGAPNPRAPRPRAQR